jgi:hypothetical protein
MNDEERFDALLEAMLTKPEPVVPAEPESEDSDETERA